MSNDTVTELIRYLLVTIVGLLGHLYHSLIKRIEKLEDCVYGEREADPTVKKKTRKHRW